MRSQKQFLCFIVLLLLNTPVFSQWDTLSTGTTSALYSVQFTDNNTGWIAGSSGVIKKTTDGGVSWQLQNSNTLQNLRRITMINSLTGFICEDSGKILKTTNGGTLWVNSNHTSATVNLYAMDFINASTGVCAGDQRTQLRTTNGGVNWTQTTMGIVVPTVIYGIEMIDATTIYATSGSTGFPAGPKIYKSTNSGSTYSVTYNDFVLFDSGEMRDVKFINSTTGFAVASNGRMIRTTNSGSTWIVTAFEDPINQVFFAGSTGYMCGDNASKARSTDNGSQWQIDFRKNVLIDLYGIWFVDSNTGWMCGSNGLLIKTINGGGIPDQCSPVETSWEKTGPANAPYNNIAVDSCGNLYITGSEDNDIVTSKYSSSGYLYWKHKKSFTGSSSGNKVITDSYGNVYVAGYCVTNLSPYNSDMLLLKYSSSGILDWYRTYDSLEVTQYALKLDVDPSGNIFIAGIHEEDDEEWHDNYLKIVKYSPGGVFQWSKTLGYDLFNNTKNYELVDIHCNSSGDLYLTGNFEDMSSYQLKSFVRKYSSEGQYLWFVNFANKRAISSLIGNGGNIFLSGRDDEDTYLARINSSGSNPWINTIVNSSPTCMTLDNTGKIILCGTVFDSDTSMFTERYNTSGDLLSSASYVYNDRSYNVPRDVSCDDSGNIYIAGQFGAKDSTGLLRYNSSGQFQNIKFYPTGSYFNYNPKVRNDIPGNVFLLTKHPGGNTHKVVKLTKNDFKFISMNLKCFIQGFYSMTSNTMVADTLSVYLRGPSSPYAIIDSSKSILSSSGTLSTAFSNAAEGPYYVVITHRNSIETWSSSPVVVVNSVIDADMTSNAVQAYGNNLKQVDTSPVRFAVFNGDVSRDGNVNLSDILQVYNAAAGFSSGYVVNDVTGDGTVNLNDITLTFNNSQIFVTVSKP